MSSRAASCSGYVFGGKDTTFCSCMPLCRRSRSSLGTGADARATFQAVRSGRKEGFNHQPWLGHLLGHEDTFVPWQGCCTMRIASAIRRRSPLAGPFRVPAHAELDSTARYALLTCCAVAMSPARRRQCFAQATSSERRRLHMPQYSTHVAGAWLLDMPDVAQTGFHRPWLRSRPKFASD
jgi:hypothetical protein